MEKNYKEYLEKINIDGPILKYGDFYYSKFFNSENTVIDFLDKKVKKIIQNILTYGNLDENEVKIVRKITFEYKDSMSITASTAKHGDGAVIYLNTGLINFLTTINATLFSYIDSNFNLVNNEDTTILKNKFAQLLFDCFNYLFNSSKIYRHINIDIPLVKNGFFGQFESDNPKELEPFFSSVNHQLEFILLHEIAHILNQDFSENDCDFFAMKVSRKIWTKNTYHTYSCEFLQLVIFLYFDFHEKYYKTRENLIKYWNNKDKKELKFGTYEYDHPPSVKRFEDIIKGLSQVSEITKYLYFLTNQLFDYTFDLLLFAELDLFDFHNITNIEKELRIQKYVHRRFRIKLPKEDAEILISKVNSEIHSSDSVFWFQKLISPFGLFYLGTIIEPKESHQKIAESYNSYFEIINNKFGKVDEKRIEIETNNYFLMIGERPLKKTNTC